MKKTYKLVKCYPGSPKLGIEVNKANSFPNYNFNGGNYTTAITAYFVENSPEFWQKIEELDYEILEVSYKNNVYGRFDGTYYYDENDVRITDITGRIHITCLNNVKITSVQRLSDSEIFSIGDKINSLTKVYSNIVIEYIDINGTSIIFNKLDEGIGLNNAEHVKTPLFTTFDGVDILDKSITVFFLRNDFQYYTMGAFNYCKQGKVFSSLEAINNYIEENKPKYSKKDMLSFGKLVWVRSPDIIGDVDYAFDKWNLRNIDKL